ncbi:MAG: DUF5908 family protein [Bacteroidia bacterium]
MPLEIRELVIRAQVMSGSPQSTASSESSGMEEASNPYERAIREAEDKRLILEAVSEMLDKKKER